MPARHDPDGAMRAVQMPDHIDVLCDMACGATAHIAVSQATGLAPYNESWIFGSEGTLRVTSSLMASYRDREAESTGIDVPTTTGPEADAPSVMTCTIAITIDCVFSRANVVRLN